MRFGFFLLISVLLLSGFVIGGDEEFDIIIRFEDGYRMPSTRAMGLSMRSNGAENFINGEIQNRFTSFNGVSAKVGREEYERLMNDPNIKVSPNYKIIPHLINATEIMNATESWNLESSDINLTGIGQTVCILDTGINYSHPDFGGCTTADFTSGNCAKVIGGYDIADGDADVMDYVGHGTHVAGIVGANGGVNGIALGANIVMVKVFDDAGNGDVADIISGIEWCTNNASKFNISVISASIGISDGDDPVMRSSSCDVNFSEYAIPVDAAVAEGISVIFSSGNNGSSTQIGVPACLSNVTPVSSTTKVDVIFNFSNRNGLVKLFATGGTSGGTTTCSDPDNPLANYICSTGYQGGYLHKSGTSMSAPMVAGAIAIINQYLNLSDQAKTPSEIEDVLYDTGLQFNESDNNFSRIDVYSALLSLDIDNPNVTLVSPVDNHINLSVNHTFICNATDWQLVNVTFKIWNSTGGLYYNESKNLTGISNESSFDLSNITEGNYLWNCLVFDDQENFAFASANFSLTIGGVEVELDSPANDKHTNINETNFTCNTGSDSNYELSNVTFYLWNSSGLVYNLTEDISGFDNSSVFNFTFENEDDYLWNCLAYNNGSENDWGNVNYSITYDVTNPNLIITSSPEGVTSNSISRSFGFNVSDINIANCSLIINDAISLTNSSINDSVLQIFSKTFTPRTYVWKINCSDYAGNVNGSSEDSFVITAVAAVVNNGGGGGGGINVASVVPIPEVFNVSTAEVSSGYTKRLKKDEKINFSVFDGDGGKHLLSVNEVGVDYVNLTLESEPVNFKLGVGQSAKFNLTSADYYDLMVVLNIITNDTAELTIQLINETIEKIVTEIVKEKTVETKVFVIKDYFWVVIVLIVVLVAIVYVVIKKNRSKDDKSDKAKKLKGSKTKKKNGRKSKKVKA